MHPLRSTLLLFAAACSSSLELPEGAQLIYQRHEDGTELVVTGTLRQLIVDELRTEPDRAEPDVGMGLDTRHSLRLDGRSLQVGEHWLMLMDDWGLRVWHVPDIQRRLVEHVRASERD